MDVKQNTMKDAILRDQVGHPNKASPTELEQRTQDLETQTEGNEGQKDHDS